VKVALAGCWDPSEQVGTVTLAWHDRHRRRFRLVDDRGHAFLLDLERATVLADRDGLVLERDGGVIAVCAADEPVIEVRAAAAPDALRLAWHVGNRHIALQVCDDGRLRMLDDPILTKMLRRLGAEPVRLCAPFCPERGAYHDQPTKPRNGG
jgi:urease accessory protein